MAGPIDTRINPTRVNELAKEQAARVVRAEPDQRGALRFCGRGRRVYPGFTQLIAFMAMNLDRHLDSFETCMYERAKGDPAKADTIRVSMKNTSRRWT